MNPFPSAFRPFISRVHANGARWCRRWFLAVVSALFAAGLTAVSAVPPVVEPVLRTGLWPVGEHSGGNAMDVAVAGHYAYAACSEKGLQVLDVSHPAAIVRTGSIDTGGNAVGVAVAGNFAYVADGYAG